MTIMKMRQKKAVKFERSYKPIAEHVKVYDALYELYKEIRISNEKLWYKRADLLKQLNPKSL